MKVLIASVMLILLPLSSLNAQTGEHFSPSGKITGLLFANYHTTFTGNENSSAFEVNRSYLGFDYRFSENFSSRVMVDGMTQTVDGKQYYSLYLRNAYLQYTNGPLMVKGGLIGSEQISVQEKLWNYRFITKPLADRAEMLYSVDLGIAARMEFSDAVSVDMAVTNGRGFKNLGADGSYRLSGGISVRPVRNLLLRGYYDIMGPTGRIEQTASITAAYTGTRFTAGSELALQANHLLNDGDDFAGLNLFTSFRCSERVSLFARIDKIFSATPAGYDEPWNITGDGVSIFGGFDYSPVAGVRLAPNISVFLPDDPAGDTKYIFGLNLEARF